MSAPAPPPLETPTHTESEILVRDFLSSHPELDKDLGEIEVMTDRYTNEEWAAQIRETQRKVLGKSSGVEEGLVRKFECPKVGSREFAETIDHTVLKLDATAGQIDALCSEARTEGFKSVCVRLNYVSRCVSNLKGSPVVVACVVGFHEGTQDTYNKLREARAAVAAGASELDVVLNHSILTAKNNATGGDKSHRPQLSESTIESLTASNTLANSKPRTGALTPAEGPYSKPEPSPIPRSPISQTAGDPIPDYSTIYRELASIRSLCPSPTVLKLILETSQLDAQQIVAAAHLAAAANFDFIKTSTGFNGPGAKLPDVQLMVAAAEHLSTKTKSNGGSPVRGSKMQVKASGGIRSLEDAITMLEAGATRLGTSSGLWIMQESRRAKQDGEQARPAATRLYTDDSVGGY
ncbi:aldolase [Lojkania enalia]|uniref:deoxyribose-phosphate aldolase n=1 Tax=Lojkania enalia TaxID=147567 RepID=A0A9P4NCQ0_9PLEO|nr:aldolase [Didymosphaeria enalia]